MESTENQTSVGNSQTPLGGNPTPPLAPLVPQQPAAIRRLSNQTACRAIDDPALRLGDDGPPGTWV